MNILKKNVLKFILTKERKCLKRTSRFITKIKKNKIITRLMVLFFLCVGMNLILIYNFIKVLQQL